MDAIQVKATTRRAIWVKFVYVVVMAKTYLSAENERELSSSLTKMQAFAKIGALGAF